MLAKIVAALSTTALLVVGSAGAASATSHWTGKKLVKVQHVAPRSEAWTSVAPRSEAWTRLAR